MAGNILFLLTVGSIAGGPFFGVVSDRYLKSRKGVVMIGFAGMVAVLAILGFVPAGTGYMAPMALFFLFGFFAAAGGVMYAHIKESLPIEMAGTAMTGINFFTMTGAAVFLQGIGKFMSWLFPLAAMDAASFRWGVFRAGRGLVLRRRAVCRDKGNFEGRGLRGRGLRAKGRGARAEGQGPRPKLISKAGPFCENPPRAQGLDDQGAKIPATGSAAFHGGAAPVPSKACPLCYF